MCGIYRNTLLKECFVNFIAVILQTNLFSKKKKKKSFLASNCGVNVSLFNSTRSSFSSPLNCKIIGDAFILPGGKITFSLLRFSSADLFILVYDEASKADSSCLFSDVSSEGLFVCLFSRARVTWGPFQKAGLPK